MSTSLSATPATRTFASRATGRLYLVRAGVALVWAGLLAAALSSAGTLTADSGLPAFAIALLIIYPVIDVVASLLDARTQQRSGIAGTARAQLVNAAISTVTAVGVAIAAADGPASVLRVFGAWASVAGLIQLILAIVRLRRGARGQWPMILSGGISTFAGLNFIIMASKTHPALSGLSGYAVLGAIFYLVSTVRLYRASRSSADHA